MKVWLIRHGITRLGEEKRYQGSLDDGLSTAGRAALKRAAFSPEHVYVSPAARARETAEVLFPDAQQRICDELREMNFGVFEGRGWWEMENDLDYQAWIEGECRGSCPGGENREEVTGRVCRGFDEILEREAAGSEAPARPDETGETVEASEEYAEGDLVIVAHGGTQMALLDSRGQPRQEYYRWQRPCGCGWLLNYEPETGTLRVIREIAFLR